MKDFIVNKLQTIETPVKVRANTKEEAILKVVNGEGFPAPANKPPRIVALPGFKDWEVNEDSIQVTIDNSHTIEMYISSNIQNCPFCAGMSAFLKSYGIDYEEIDIATNTDKREFLNDKTGNTRVPKLRINDNFVTGFNPVGLFNDLKKGKVLNEIPT